MGNWYVVLFFVNGRLERVGAFTDPNPTCHLRYSTKRVNDVGLSHNTAKTLAALISYEQGVQNV